jgi:hypothetical protein
MGVKWKKLFGTEVESIVLGIWIQMEDKATSMADLIVLS